jgi:arylsulfatase
MTSTSLSVDVLSTKCSQATQLENEINMQLKRVSSIARFVLVVAAVCFSSDASTAFSADPMNVLVLYADDWRHDTLGVAGNPVVQTPNLDSLASEGMRFTENCVTTSICGISRASLYTGQWMARHGCRAFKPWKTPWAETYPGLLRENGYHLGHVGKWHNGKIPAEDYDFSRVYHGRHWYPTEDGGKVHFTTRN